MLGGLVKKVESNILTIRLERNELERLKEISKKEEVELGSLLQEIVKLGILAWKKKRALELYKKGEVTLSKAAEMCGLTIYDLIDEIRRQNIPITVYTEDLREIVFESARSRAEYYRLLEEMGKE